MLLPLLPESEDEEDDDEEEEAELPLLVVWEVTVTERVELEWLPEEDDDEDEEPDNEPDDELCWGLEKPEPIFDPEPKIEFNS